MVDLRPYQEDVIRQIYELIRQGKKRILVVSPTGSGKTIMASQVITHAVERAKRTFFTVHRDILVKQTASKLGAFDVQCGFLKSRYQENRNAMAQIASVQTMERRDWWRSYPLDLIMLDECHITSWATVIQQMMNVTHPEALYIGWTGSPWRLSPSQGMGDIYDSLVCAPMPEELIKQGFLVKPSYWSIDCGDFDSVELGADGDFNESKLAIATDLPETNAQIVEAWKKYAYGRRTLVYGVDVTHSKNLCKAFLEGGISAAHIDGRMSHKKREKLYEGLEKGEILALCSCQALTEGFDVPSVSAIILDRATESKALYTQMVGRGLRLSPETGKVDCVILDCVGNVIRHRWIEDIKEIKLTKGKEVESDLAPPVKACPTEFGGCGAIIYAFQMLCPHCKYHFESKKLQIALKLKQRIRPEDIERIQFYRRKLKEAYLNQSSPGWAANIFIEKYGFWPPMDWGKGAVFEGLPKTEMNQQLYRDYLILIAARLQKDYLWVEKHLKIEF